MQLASVKIEANVSSWQKKKKNFSFATRLVFPSFTRDHSACITF